MTSASLFKCTDNSSLVVGSLMEGSMYSVNDSPAQVVSTAVSAYCVRLPCSTHEMTCIRPSDCCGSLAKPWCPSTQGSCAAGPGEAGPRRRDRRGAAQQRCGRGPGGVVARCTAQGAILAPLSCCFVTDPKDLCPRPVHMWLAWNLDPVVTRYLDLICSCIISGCNRKCEVGIPSVTEPQTHVCEVALHLPDLAADNTCRRG